MSLLKTIILKRYELLHSSYQKTVFDEVKNRAITKSSQSLLPGDKDTW